MIYTDCALTVSQSIYFIADESGPTTLALANCSQSRGYANVISLLGIKQWRRNIIGCLIDGGLRYGTIELYSGLGSCWIYFGRGWRLLGLWPWLIFAMLISFGATLRQISRQFKVKAVTTYQDAHEFIEAQNWFVHVCTTRPGFETLMKNLDSEHDERE